jgi:hypothetical protein
MGEIFACLKKIKSPSCKIEQWKQRKYREVPKEFGETMYKK